METLVSVIIPTYNREATIEASIKSALDQTYRALEIVVIDDGSTDGTTSLLRQFGDRIQVYRQKNAGAAAARNAGVQRSHGEIVAFLDSDDTWSPAKLEQQLALLDKAGPKVTCCLTNVQFIEGQCGCYTSFDLADMRPKIEEGVWLNPAEVLITRFVLFNQALAIRRDALLKAGLFRSDLPVLEDWDLAIRIAFLGPWAFMSKPQVLYGVPQSSGVSRKGDKDPTLIPRLMVDIMQRLWQGHPSAVPFERMFRRETRYWISALRAVRWKNSPSLVRRSLGSGLGAALRVRNAAFRRSPLWPRMQVQTVDEFAAAQRGGIAMAPALRRHASHRSPAPNPGA